MPVGVYRPRRPRASPLCRLVETHYDEVKGQWEGRFGRRYGFWRGFVDEQVRRFLDCGLFDNGFARIRCPDCHEEYLLAFSCKTRELCLSCAANRSAATAALLAEDGLEDVGRAQWVPASYVDEHAAEMLLRHKVLRLLQGAGLLTEERTHLLLSWRHTGFSVHTRVRVEPEDQGGVERLARYILRPPISLERMSWDGRGEVRYRRKTGHDGGAGLNRQPDERFDPADVLARVLMHIPEPRRHLTHYYGAYSNASRGRRRRELEAAAEAGEPPEQGARQAAPADERRLRRRWSQLVKRVYEVDLLVCPRCGGDLPAGRQGCKSSPSSSTPRSSTGSCATSSGAGSGESGRRRRRPRSRPCRDAREGPGRLQRIAVPGGGVLGLLVGGPQKPAHRRRARGLTSRSPCRRLEPGLGASSRTDPEPEPCGSLPAVRKKLPIPPGFAPAVDEAEEDVVVDAQPWLTPATYAHATLRWMTPFNRCHNARGGTPRRRSLAGIVPRDVQIEYCLPCRCNGIASIEAETHMRKSIWAVL